MEFEFDILTNPSSKQIEQIIKLYKIAGWWDSSNDDPKLVKNIVAGSHFFVAALKDKNIIGMGRAISDRVSDAYIQDVTVEKSYREQGIGTSIIKFLIENLRSDGLKWIGLIAERNSYRFYERFGFKIMENATPMINLIKGE
ncbi:MAG: GNAT family N-acetyltransferase [Desulfobacterales bacterium]|nr:GNAT family N-acetyltransferase [Desulfobacterales bacterium]